ncbi:histidine phosphatase family protein [Curvivirga aplysinae]|uniref:histidine phosphatase family protein n=1 Tax=Curvivirga aplysinae TaxID=2529852 RepID=UPI0012BCB32E|nr:histidine phosphatase family protein [Curvivirga aplysinae]MTI08830.1 histidine phosphatase family protein [Curvivirga aplysinae]
MTFKPLKNTYFRRRIYLMRHGDVSYFDKNNKPVDEPNKVQLTKLGRKQAQDIGSLLSGTKIDRAICSGLIRTEQTAQLVLGDRKISIEAESCFMEIQPKGFDQIPIDRREDELAYAFENAYLPGASYGAGETFVEFATRVTNKFYEIVRQTDWSQLLIVAHDGVNRLLLSLIASNCRATAETALFSMGGYDQDTCCLNILDIDVKDNEINLSRIKTLNYTPDNPLKTDNHFSSMEKVFNPYVTSNVKFGP